MATLWCRRLACRELSEPDPPIHHTECDGYIVVQAPRLPGVD